MEFSRKYLWLASMQLLCVCACVNISYIIIVPFFGNKKELDPRFLVFFLFSLCNRKKCGKRVCGIKLVDS